MNSKLFSTIRVALYLLLAPLAGCTTTAPSKPVSPSLAGTWLVESNSWESGRDIVRGTVRLSDNALSIVGYRGQEKPWTGTYTLGQGNDLDLRLDPYTLGPPQGPNLLVPRMKVCAAYQLQKVDGVDHLTVCYPMHSTDARPKTFNEPEGADDPRILSLVRANRSFVAFPKDVRIKVLRPDGRPAAGSELFSMMRFFPTLHSTDGGKTITTDPGPLKWTIGAATVIRADATGTIQIPFTAFESQTDFPIGVRNPEDGSIAFLKPSAALLGTGATTVVLKPVRNVRGIIRPGAEVPYFSPTVTLGPAGYLAKDGKFEFPIPPGVYRLNVYGQDLYTYRKWVTVPDGVGDVDLGTFTVHVSEGLSLIGKQVPPLEGVVAWKNGAVDPTALKGKVVLINFWGYWCGGCVNEMPTLFHLHEKYKDRGLVIVGVHIDAQGEVDTVEKLDQRTLKYRNGFWHGDIPYPSALASGQSFGKDRSRAGSGYGVTGYPTTVIVGRDGRVIGEVVGSNQSMMGSKATLDLSNDAGADSSVEHLLAQ
jgi:thiol-disulfide isomerase/thioredoxin